MTLGKKIKQARKTAGLSQERLSEKLCISRSAVAKWETDRGIPDIDNLKIISRLLGVSIDYLLDDEEFSDNTPIKEPIDLSYHDGRNRKAMKDRIIREKYPYAKIYTLFAKTKRARRRKITDKIMGFNGYRMFVTSDLVYSVKNNNIEYYLVEQGNIQLIVLIGDDFIISRIIRQKQYTDKFEIGNIKFRKCGCEVK